MSRIRHLTTPALAVALSALALGACGGEGAIDTSDLESKLSDQLGRSMGTSGDEVRCPADIEARRGHRFDCTISGPEGERVRVGVTLTNADGGFRAVFPREERPAGQDYRAETQAP